MSAVLALLVSAIGYSRVAPVAAISHVQNPWLGEFGLGATDSTWQAQVDSFAQSITAQNPKMSSAASLVKSMPTGIWLDTKAAVNGTGGNTGLTAHLDAAVKQQTTNNPSNLPLVVDLVIYDIPGRDCNAAASNGEEPATAAGLTDYETSYIDVIANTLGNSNYANLRFALFIEPDSLPNLVTNMSNPNCTAAAQYYENGIAYALSKFHAISNAYTFLDISNATWLSWHPADGATEFAKVAGMAGGVATVDGFVSNVSNYVPYYEQLLYGPTSIPLATIKGQQPFYNQPDLDEYSFQTDMRSALMTAGFPSTIGFVTDTSRDGWGGLERPVTTSASTDPATYVRLSRIDKRTVTSDWCNPSGAGIGYAPQAYPFNNNLIDGIHPPNWEWSFVWVKPPGQSDGTSDASGSGESGYDSQCDPASKNIYHTDQYTGAMPHTPHAGSFNNAHFAQLLDHAVPQFNSGTQGALTSTAPNPANGSCSASYAPTNTWTDGTAGSTWEAFSGTVTVKNTGSIPTAAWQVTLNWANNEIVTSGSGAGMAQVNSIISTGSQVQSPTKTLTASNLTTNAVISAGGSTTFSVIGSSYGSLVSPTLSCTSKAGGTPGAPQPPASVTAKAGNLSATVSWTASPADGGSRITGYTVTSSAGQTCTTTGSTTLACVITGLTNGTSYTFTVKAQNGIGSSGASAQSNPVTPARVPDAPTLVTALAGAGQATVRWTAPAYNGGSDITGYSVTSVPGSNGCATTGVTTCVVSGLTGGVTYTFTAYAINAIGVSAASTASKAVTPTTPTLPGAPTSVVALNGNALVTVTWAAPTTGGAASTYTATTNSGQTCTATGALTCTITGLTNGVLYTVTVTASNSVGTGPASAVSNGAIPFTVPDAPTTVIATGGAGQATVSWTPPAFNGGAFLTGYTVTSSGGQTCATTGTYATPPTPNCTVTGLKNGTSYTFTVKAANDAGSGAASTASLAVIPTATTPTCTASVTFANQSAPWMSGSNGYAQIAITVTNSGSVPVKGWTVTITWPKAMTLSGSVANGTLVSGNGTTTWVITNVSYNGAIAVGASVPSAQDPNFQVYGSGAYAAPANVTCSAT
jgi:cellulose 1,4-beta-cellobiosidase